MVSSSSLSSSVLETMMSSWGNAIIDTDGPGASQKLTIVTLLSLSSLVLERTLSSEGCTIINRHAGSMSITLTLLLPSMSELKIFLHQQRKTCLHMYLLCLTSTCKVFVRKFSVRSVSHVNVLQWTYNQLICELVFLTEKSNLQPTLSHYKNLPDSL